MLEIPLIAWPNQEFTANLAGQSCRIRVQDREGHTFLDLTKGQKLLRQGAICTPLTPILTRPVDFTGNLVMIDVNSAADTQTDPVYTGYGTRWRLYYITEDEEAAYFVSTP